MPTPTTLVAFVRAAELGSFAAAARHLDMSPAAVGQAVQRLEEGFGVKLLHRSTRRMRLTDDGRLLFERCKTLVNELATVGDVLQEARGEVSGPLRISAPAGLARTHVLPLVASFLRLHPEVDVTLDATDTVRDVGAGDVDVAFRILRPADSSVVTRRLGRIAATTVASPAYLERHGRPRHPRDLAARRCVLYRHAATGVLTPLTFRIQDRDRTVVPPAAIVVNDVDAGVESAALGLGIAQPPATYVAQHVADGRLVTILDRFVAHPWTLYLCRPAGSRVPARVRAFMDLAQRELPRALRDPPRDPSRAREPA
ncbi:MAG: LysR family transcriptional regulator [Deltaproteobacteria bacterium]|nr:LysR family transcriptional regulator [Deltaproteobacteria bacterium]